MLSINFDGSIHKNDHVTESIETGEPIYDVDRRHPPESLMDRPTLEERYGSAVTSHNLRQDLAHRVPIDILTAAGFAGRKHALGLSLWRLAVADASHGMWRRVALTLFEVTIPEDRRDATLLGKLKEEGSGILNWALGGLRQWQEKGLAPPDKVKAATAEYRNDQDVLATWLADRCNVGPKCRVPKDELYRDYRTWATNNGHAVMSQTSLSRRLAERGFSQDGGRRHFQGIALIDDWT